MPPRTDTPADTLNSVPGVNTSRRSFLKGIATLGSGLVATGLLAGEQTPALAVGGSGIPGSAKAWHAPVSVYAGGNNLSTGNTQLVLPVCAWGGLGGGISLVLVFNSQSTRSSALGAKWTHTYNLFLTGSNPVVFVDGDGTENAYTLSGNAYTPPAGCFDTLVHNADSTWTLTKKGGTKFNFTSAGVLSTIVDTNGLTTTLTYTGGLLTSVKDAANRILALAYTGGLLTTITDCLNRAYTLTYGTSGQIARLNTPLLAGLSYNQQLTYDANHNVASLTDRMGRMWSYLFNSSSVLQSTTLPGGASGGKVPPVAPPAAFAPLVGIGVPVWPANVVTVAGWQDATNAITQYGLDNLGRLVAVQDAASNQSVYTYDNSHNRTATQLPSGKTWNSTFDGYGNELISQDPLGHQTVKTVDGPSGRILTNIDANSNETTLGYDGHGNLTSLQDGNGYISTYGVNALGQQTSTTDAELRLSQTGYDVFGFQNSSTDPLSHVTQFVNNAVGQTTQRTDALSRVTNYTLDDWSRTTGVAYPTSGNASLGFVYNAAGQLTQTSDGTGIRTYGYNTLGQRTSMTDPRGNTSATYDNAGNLLTQTDVTTRTITNTLNNLNQLTSVLDGNDNAHADYTYTVDGKVNTATFPNGTKATYGYDNANRVTSLVHTKVSDGSTLVGYTATYDNGNRLTSITEQPSGDVTTFTYDSADNLLTETRTGTKPYSGTYTYDKSNRRKTAIVVTNGVTMHNGTYTYDAAGRLSQVVDSATGLTEVYTWNNDGTLARYPGPTGSGYTRVLTYDEEQHLLTIAHDFGGGNVVNAYAYGYAADGGRRWQKDLINSVWTWYPCGVACTAGELVEQTSNLTGSTWTTSALYLKVGSGCGASIIRRNSEYHHFDVQGSLSTVTGTNAAVLSVRIYDHFGVQQFISGSAQTPWTSSSRYIDAEGMSVARQCFLITGRTIPLSNTCQASKSCEKRGSHIIPYRDCTGARLVACQRDCAVAHSSIKQCCERDRPPFFTLMVCDCNPWPVSSTT
jgi:YD repeat-containing protein